MAHRAILMSVLLAFFFVSSILSFAGERYAPSGRDRYTEPLPDEAMTEYRNIPFSLDNFEKIQRGMTEREVLGLLGEPVRVEREHRRHDRWTVHYSYPDNHVVNFKDGLVVGKE